MNKNGHVRRRSLLKNFIMRNELVSDDLKFLIPIEPSSKQHSLKIMNFDCLEKKPKKNSKNMEEINLLCQNPKNMMDDDMTEATSQQIKFETSKLRPKSRASNDSVVTASTNQSTPAFRKELIDN